MSFFGSFSRSSELLNGATEEDDYESRRMDEATDGMERIGGTSVQNPLQCLNAAYSPATGVALAARVQYHSYSRDIAELLSQVSGWSYSNKETFQNQLSWLSINNNTILAEGYFYEFSTKNEALLVDATAQLILTHDGTTAFVSFRGTGLTNPWNFLSDLSTKKVPLFANAANCRVHLGFKRNFQAVWYGAKGLLSQLQAHAPTLEAIYVTGHSLGGAMALLAGLALEHQEPELWRRVRGIFTYGQPMVLDDRDRNPVEARIGSRVFRHIYRDDVVPHLPPLSVGGYDHVGSEYRYYPNGGGWGPRTGHPNANPLVHFGKDRATQIVSALLVLPAVGYDLIWDNLEFVLPFSKSPWSLADHIPGNYMDNW
jgi:predicted lipase